MTTTKKINIGVSLCGAAALLAGAIVGNILVMGVGFVFAFLVEFKE